MTNVIETPHDTATNQVAVYRAAEGKYPSSAPYHPSESYPEYPFETTSHEPNYAYEAVRGALRLAGRDRARFGTAEWNPLGDIISENDMVVIKPNMVRDFHDNIQAGTEALITHASIVRAVVDYVYLALGKKGRVVIADSPQNDADWEGLWRAFEFDALLAFYKKAAPEFVIDIYDVRKEAVISRNGVVVKRHQRPGDPLGYATIDLGENSEFEEVPGRFGKFYGSEYDISQTNQHHERVHHEYNIGKTFLKADVIINVPKLKTHKKVGLTCWIKSAVGICGDKNWLPHHTLGTPGEGGDQFAEDNLKRKTEQRLLVGMKKTVSRTGMAGGVAGSVLRKWGAHLFGDTNTTIRSGNWYGNDTIWRTVLDLNKCWTYADKDGRLCQTPQRKFLCIVDAIVAGEGNGPLSPDSKPAGVCIVGLDAIATDTAAAVLMGFDPEKLPILTRAGNTRGYVLQKTNTSDVEIVSNVESWTGKASEVSETLSFTPHFGWKGHIER